MARDRRKLQVIFEEIIGNRNVYFQPPESLKLQYPCIIYQRSTGDTHFADNTPHFYLKKYQVTVIDKNPDSPIPDKIAKLPMCVHDRTYISDNLTHDAFNIYF